MALTYRSFKMIIIFLLIAFFNFCYYQNGFATALVSPTIPEKPLDFWDFPTPPAFTDNNAISVILDHKNGNWRYYISPYLNAQPHENQYFGISQAYLEWDNGTFGFDIGRKIIMHGPGRYGYPVLGPLGTGVAAQGYDQIGYHFTWGILKAHKFYASVSESSYRMLIGQRATIDLGPFTLGASEEVLVNDQTPALFYVPIPFNPNSNTTNSSENKLVEADIAWRLNEDFKLYGQYFIDDIPMYGILNWTPSPVSDQWPWRCGYQGGVEWQNAFHNPDLTLYTEYTKVNQYTYTHDNRKLNWTYHGYYIGESLGPDADRINVELVWKQSPEWQWSFAYQRTRHGEGQIGDPYIHVPGQTNLCLTGVVEITDLLAVGVTRKHDNLEIGFTLGLANIQNADHVEGRQELTPKVSVNAKYYLP